MARELKGPCTHIKGGQSKLQQGNIDAVYIDALHYRACTEGSRQYLEAMKKAGFHKEIA